MVKAIDRSLDIYLEAAKGKTPKANTADSRLLRIGGLSKKTGESVATLRHWTKEGLLHSAGHTDSGYTLYPPEATERAKRIRELQSERLSLGEIGKRIGQD